MHRRAAKRMVLDCRPELGVNVADIQNSLTCFFCPFLYFPRFLRTAGREKSRNSAPKLILVVPAGRAAAGTAASAPQSASRRSIQMLPAFYPGRNNASLAFTIPCTQLSVTSWRVLSSLQRETEAARRVEQGGGCGAEGLGLEGAVVAAWSAPILTLAGAQEHAGVGGASPKSDAGWEYIQHETLPGMENIIRWAPGLPLGSRSTGACRGRAGQPDGDLGAGRRSGAVVSAAPPQG